MRVLKQLWYQVVPTRILAFFHQALVNAALSREVDFWKSNCEILDKAHKEMKERADRFHRRAQRAEGGTERALNEMQQIHDEVESDLRDRLFDLQRRLDKAEIYMSQMFPALDAAGFKYASEGNMAKLEEVEKLEEELKRQYKRIHIPPQPEMWSTGR